MTLKKLLMPSQYGFEEYAVVSLIIFILFVALKHFIFHTLYHWWYGEGRLYLPNKFWNLYTGKSLPERILLYAKKKLGQSASLEDILRCIESYSEEREFALTLGKDKGKVLDKAVNDRKPEVVLVCGSLCGYAVLRILRQMSKKAHVYVFEEDPAKSSVTKKFCNWAGFMKEVTVLNSDPTVGFSILVEDFDVEKIDFIFLTSTSHSKSNYLDVVRLLEKRKLLHQNMSQMEGPQTVILADKVVHFGENEFLKHIRYSSEYETKYFQMSLEYSPSDIIDGMERAVYTGR